jgi:hypothetical protein
MDLWETMGWGEEPLNHTVDGELFCGVRRSEFDNWFRETPFWRRHRDPDQMVRVEDGDKIVEMKCPTITNSIFSDVSLSVISADISRNILKISVGGIIGGGFRDLILREAHYTTAMEYHFEIHISEKNMKDISWDTLSMLDRKTALRCVVISGGVMHTEIIAVIEHYIRVRSDWTGELPPSIPPKIMKVVKA